MVNCTMDTIKELRKFNRWRRGLDAWHEDAQPNPQEVGRNIDDVCDELERLRGESTVFIGLLVDCAAVIRTIEGENSDESDALHDLLDKIDMAIDSHRHRGTLI